MSEESPERWKNLVIILTIINTVFAAVLAALQADASIRASIADRDSQYYAVEASAELYRSGLAENYDFAIFNQTLNNQQEAYILQFTALSQQISGFDTQAGLTQALAASSQARADAGRKFSVLYRDPRYAPQTESDSPDLKAYVADLNARANQLVASQNQAVDAYHTWNKKADDDVTVLTVLAVAFLLFGIAQTIHSSRLRLLFAGFGGLVQLVCLVWTVGILIK